MTQGSRSFLLVALGLTACTFEPRKSGIEFGAFIVAYARPRPEEVVFTYQVKQTHELQKLCTYLVKKKEKEPLSLRGPTYVAATPEHCFIVAPVILRPGEKQRFTHSFSGGSGFFTDSRAKMKAVLRIKILREKQMVSEETEWPFN